MEKRRLPLESRSGPHVPVSPCPQELRHPVLPRPPLPTQCCQHRLLQRLPCSLEILLSQVAFLSGSARACGSESTLSPLLLTVPLNHMLTPLGTGPWPAPLYPRSPAGSEMSRKPLTLEGIQRTPTRD